MEEDCPGCAVTVVNNTIAQTGSGEVVGTVVAAVQRDPSIDYVITGTGGQVFTGLAAALDAAGLGDQVKIGGGAGTPTNLTNVQAGTEDAYTLIPSQLHRVEHGRHCACGTCRTWTSIRTAMVACRPSF